MPVYREHRLVHVHIPKTGGTPIESYFHSIGDMVWGPPSLLGQQRRDDRWYELQHLTRAELSDLTGPEFDDYESFAVVRDPYARLVSEFRWRQAISAAYPDSPTRGFESFDAFLAAIPRDVDKGWDALIGEADRSEANFLIHVRPQHHYVLDSEGAVVVDHIVRFEHLRDDMTPILEARGLTAETLLNARRFAVEEHFSPEQRELVAELYPQDLARFSYFGVDTRRQPGP